MSHAAKHMEHRWGERTAIDLPITVAVHSRSGVPGTMKNLSLSGALIRSSMELRVNALIRVSVLLPHRPPYETVLLAQVVHITNGHAGIEWCEFAPRLVKEMLRSLICCH
jgi:hypothetical protein